MEVIVSRTRNGYRSGEVEYPFEGGSLQGSAEVSLEVDGMDTVIRYSFDGGVQKSHTVSKEYTFRRGRFSRKSLRRKDFKRALNLLARNIEGLFLDVDICYEGKKINTTCDIRCN